jgi:hypothetical protein
LEQTAVLHRILGSSVPWQRSRHQDSNRILLQNRVLSDSSVSRRCFEVRLSFRDSLLCYEVFEDSQPWLDLAMVYDRLHNNRTDHSENQTTTKLWKELKNTNVCL